MARRKRNRALAQGVRGGPSQTPGSGNERPGGPFHVGASSPRPRRRAVPGFNPTVSQPGVPEPGMGRQSKGRTQLPNPRAGGAFPGTTVNVGAIKPATSTTTAQPTITVSGLGLAATTPSSTNKKRKVPSPGFRY